MRYRYKLLLRLLPLDSCLLWISPDRTPDENLDSADQELYIKRIEKMTDWLLRRFRPTRTTCLIRALLRYRLLNEQGIPASFVMGVRPEAEGDVMAHAWITLDNKPVMERKKITYKQIFRYPESGEPVI
jgi:hypothetical protein